MILLLELIAVGIFVLIGVNVYNGMRRNPSLDDHRFDSQPGNDNGASSPAQSAAETLKDFEQASAALKASYPALFAMLGGYLNEHTIHEHGGPEGAVEEMIRDWTPRRDEVIRELTKLLAECDTEDELRAVVLAASDASFDEEGYRQWLTWLMGRFNTI